MDIKQTVGKRVQQYRKQKGLTQEALAELIGIDTISLSKIETGRNYPTAENISKLARILGVEVYELFVNDVEKTNEQLMKEILVDLEKIADNNKKLQMLKASILTILWQKRRSLKNSAL